MFNDDWMKMKGYLDVKGLTAKELVGGSQGLELKTLEQSETVSAATKLMRDFDFSQVPVTKNGRIVGSINETYIYSMLVKDPGCKDTVLEKIMQPAFPFVDISTPAESLAAMLTNENPAVLVKDFKTDSTFIITRHDVLKALC
jgi:cystathionine beta-synthase